MKYYNATEAAKKLGIGKQDVVKMVRKKGLKAGKKKGEDYRIPESEIKRLAKRVKRDQTRPDRESINTPQIQRAEGYTATEASEKLKIPRSRIIYLIKKGKIQAFKGKAPTSPFIIPESELQKLHNISIAKAAEKKEPVVLEEPEKIQPKMDLPQDRYYEDFIEIRKDFVAAMCHLAAAQEKIASTLSKLAEKI